MLLLTKERAALYVCVYPVKMWTYDLVQTWDGGSIPMYHWNDTFQYLFPRFLQMAMLLLLTQALN